MFPLSYITFNIRLFSITIIYSFNKMKKEVKGSSIIVLSCSESSGDESEKEKCQLKIQRN